MALYPPGGGIPGRAVAVRPLGDSVDELIVAEDVYLKAFLRAGMLLVMKRKNAYSRDLYPSYRSFAEYYPQHGASMLKCLELAIDPVTSVRLGVERFGLEQCAPIAEGAYADERRALEELGRL